MRKIVMILSTFFNINMIIHRRKVLHAQVSSCMVKLVIRFYFESFVLSFSDLEKIIFLSDLLVSVLISLL